MSTRSCRRQVLGALAAGLAAVLMSGSALAQIKAQPPKGTVAPPWDKGILPISPESYWNAVACGKQGGENPPCVFWDTGLCKNEDFALAMYTPYKMVAYEVWRVVSQHKDPPTPSYQEAQRTRVTIGVTPVPGSKNAISALVVKREGRVVKPATQSFDRGGGRFTFDYPAFAATADIAIDMTGKVSTRTCTVDQTVLARFR